MAPIPFCQHGWDTVNDVTDAMPKRIGPEVSVVIPVGGVDRWLDVAVASVLRDQHVDLELIAVFNNGADVPRDWPFLDDPRVRVIQRREALGPAGAGQLGIDAANGDYLACLDADDLAYPGRFAAQLEWMRKHPRAMLVGSHVDWIDDHGQRIGKFELPSGDDVRGALVKLNVVPHSAWMARLSGVRAVGGYNLDMGQMEDYDLLLRLGVLGPIGVLPETLTAYRLHSGQMSRSVRPNGNYVREIARGRRKLGEAIGVHPLQVWMAGAYWEAQQWLMYVGRRVFR